MEVGRGANFKQVPINIVGSSVYGIYDKMDSQHTYNMTISDDFLVPYPGYKRAIYSDQFNNASEGRALYESVKLGYIIAVFDSSVYRINLNYDHRTRTVENPLVSLIGNLQTSTGVVYIAENNKPQILISDNVGLYVYDPSLVAVSVAVAMSGTLNTIQITGTYTFAIGEQVTFTNLTGTLAAALTANLTYYILSTDTTSSVGNTLITVAATQNNVYNNNPVGIALGAGTGNIASLGAFQTIPTSFVPGYITFHDTYFHCAASQDDFYAPPASNTWRLSMQNNGFVWASLAQTIGLLETKPDKTQAVVRFPSRGNMIFVMGKTVTESWFDVGAQLFPYERQNQFNIDYGCLNPATVAFMDEIVVWLGANEKSGPIILFSTGGQPEKITTDGIDYQFSELEHPEEAQGFLFRKNGHLFYHINFYIDNISFIVDFTNKKIFNACDQHLNYYSMGQVVWFKNQYYAITKDNGNLFVFDTVFTTYQTVDPNGQPIESEIPRIRVCDNIRLPSQDYFILNDVGFTIETGETDYYPQSTGPLFLITEDGNKLTTEDYPPFIITEDGYNIAFENDNRMISENDDGQDYNLLISEQEGVWQSTPRVDLSVSWDGGASFSSDMPYVLNPIGKRKNRLMWWNIGMGNDIVCQFKFWGIGRVVATNGIANIRQ